MIRTLTIGDRETEFVAFEEMFRARAAVFHERLGWQVAVKNGMEIDRYDLEEDPIYLVASNSAGHLTGSLRLLPTTGDTMLRNEFAGFFDEPVDVESPTAWECTRFCVHPTKGWQDSDSGLPVSSELLVGLCELCLSSGIEQVIGLYDSRMTRIYARIGWAPSPLAVSRPEIGKLIVGIWDVSTYALQEMKRRAVTKKLSGSTRGTRRKEELKTVSA